MNVLGKEISDSSYFKWLFVVRIAILRCCLRSLQFLTFFLVHHPHLGREATDSAPMHLEAGHMPTK